MTEDMLVTEIEGPRGTAEIFEVTLMNGQISNVEYAVVFGDQRRQLPSLGEAHILANQLTGLDDDS